MSGIQGMLDELMRKLSASWDRQHASRARAKQRGRITPTRHRFDNVSNQLLVDVSIISQNDAQTGIQRVVRAIVQQLLSNPAPEGFTVRMVAATRKSPYRIAEWPNEKPDTDPVIAAENNSGKEVVIRPGDIFLGLDLCTRIIPAHQKQLAEWQRAGAKLNFVVYDLLPLMNPGWFPEKSVRYFQRWLTSLVILADQIICISAEGAMEFGNYTASNYKLQNSWVPVRTIPMGNDIAATQPSTGLPTNFTQILEKSQKYKSVLIVGTLEPRKGHEQVLNAFEQLWNSGRDYTLVLVGRPGWKTDHLQTRIKNHPELNGRLIWLTNASDEALDQLYRNCKGVLIASLGEGFGLPLIEALGYEKPVLVRDIPVFREHQDTNITFFKADNPIELAIEIANWMEQFASRNGSSLNQITKHATWSDSTAALWATLKCKNKNSNQIVEPENYTLKKVS